MRYLDELLRNLVAEAQLWVRRRLARGAAPRVAGAGSPTVRAFTGVVGAPACPQVSEERADTGGLVP